VHGTFTDTKKMITWLTNWIERDPPMFMKAQQVRQP
jgi:hypothetical protein